MHYLHSGKAGKKRAANGSTIMKRRHLALLGYKAVSVPYWEWAELKDAQGREAYLRAKLSAGDA